jgi:hypothetical protein
VYTGAGAVWENLTHGLPVLNPNCAQRRGGNQRGVFPAVGPSRSASVATDETAMAPDLDDMAGYEDTANGKSINGANRNHKFEAWLAVGDTPGSTGKLQHKLQSFDFAPICSLLLCPRIASRGSVVSPSTMSPWSTQPTLIWMQLKMQIQCLQLKTLQLHWFAVMTLFFLAVI